MDEKKLDQFFDTLIDIVDADGPFKEKKDAILRAAKAYGERAETALEEFTSWFE